MKRIILIFLIALNHTSFSQDKGIIFNSEINIEANAINSAIINEVFTSGYLDNNLKNRIKHHKYYNDKSDRHNMLYQYIRENGGWSAWNVSVLECIEECDRFKLFEFREFVKVAQEKAVAVLNGKLKASRTLRTRISNTNDDLDEIYERLDTENGGLMKRILGNDDTSSPLRFVCGFF